ncbi:MAG: Vitamin epoxide reductase [Actinobacteria bacterium]|nr:Vitamin epoxide reductase [Actinomycetota bacterium]
MRRRLALLALLLAVAATSAPPASAEEGSVRAVLFFSPTCGHCQYVINELLLPVWFPQYGGEPEWRYDASLGDDAGFYLVTNGTLEVLMVNRDVPAGREFYDASAEALAIPQERRGVPRLVVGDTYLVGSAEIPEQFPGMIEAALAAGGINWPGLPGIEEILAGIPTEPMATTTIPGDTTTAPAATTAATSTVPAEASTTTVTEEVVLFDNDSPWDRFRQDTAANSLALVVLVLMVLSLAGVAVLARRGDEAGPPGMAVPLLGLAGLAVAAYLAFVETSGTEAVCGPVGNCNTVQQSEWARVLGVHIGVIGVVGYALVLAAWAVARFARGPLADWARVALFAGAVVGTGFSIYLTFLEPFVIGATCLWCLSSAVIVTVLMWVTARSGAAAWGRLRAGD